MMKKNNATIKNNKNGNQTINMKQNILQKLEKKVLSENDVQIVKIVV